MSHNNTEVTQESRERLETIELAHTPRPEKMARENALLEGASEVRYAQRAFRPHHPATMDEIRARVDALHLPTKRSLPTPALPPAIEPLAPRIPDALRAALEPTNPDATLVSAESVYRTDDAQVVEATFELDGARRTEQYVIENDVARPLDDITARIDALAPPRPPPANAPSAPQVEAESAPAKKPRFGFGKKEKEAPAADEKPAKKSRFSFKRAKDE